MTRRDVLRGGWLLAPPLLVFALACANTGPGGVHARFGYSESGGLRVVEVPERGPAASAGLEVGDRVISVDGEPVRRLTMSEVVEKLRGTSGTYVELELEREGRIVEIRVRRAPYRRDDG